MSVILKKCGYCKGKLVTDTETQEVNCSKCGLVIEQNTPAMDMDSRSFEGQPSNSRTGANRSSKYHDYGLSTVISTSTTDGTGRKLSNNEKNNINRLRKWDNRSKVTKSKDKNLHDALIFLARVSSKLSLPEYIIEESSNLYRKALERNMIRGRSISAMIASSIYAACRLNNQTLTIKDIAIASLVKEKEIARCYRLLYYELELKPGIADPAKNLSWIADGVGLHQKVVRTALDILNKAKADGELTGKSPVGLAGAALYIAAKMHDANVTQRDIGLVANITEVTIRNRYKDLRKYGNR